MANSLNPSYEQLNDNVDNNILQPNTRKQHDIDLLDLRRLVGKLGFSAREHTDPNITNTANEQPNDTVWLD